MPEGLKIVSSLFEWIEGLYRLPDRVRVPNKFSLAFEIQVQEWDNWCWAATASSISRHFDRNDYLPQSEIVGRSLGLPPPWVADKSWDKGAPMLTGLHIVGCEGSTYAGSTDLRHVLRQLDKGNPVCVQIKWPLKGGHAVVIHGCWLDETGADHFLVGDPGYGSSSPTPGNELRDNYIGRGGEWVQTYHVRAP